MSFESVKSWLAERAPDLHIIDNGQETATVAEAATALGVEPGRIAKTLALRVGSRIVLLVTRGDARVDNRKCKDVLGGRPRFLSPEETLEITGHPVGGVCPFGLATVVPVYCDTSLQAYTTVFPAAGSRTASVELRPKHLRSLLACEWVDVARIVDQG